MGLDWLPMSKPKPGYEERWKEIFLILRDKQEQELSNLDKLEGKQLKSKDELFEEWLTISIKSYETIKAPRVGRDKIADDWIKEKYQKTKQTISQEEFLQKYNGYYVIELAEEVDGVPVYSSFDQDENVFRGKFLKDCKNVIDDNLLNEAWETKFADETLLYGQQLMAVADELATKNNKLYVKEERFPPNVDEESVDSQIHILYAAAKWLIFYGKNGHGYEADY